MFKIKSFFKILIVSLFFTACLKPYPFDEEEKACIEGKEGGWYPNCCHYDGFKKLNKELCDESTKCGKEFAECTLPAKKTTPECRPEYEKCVEKEENMTPTTGNE